jgi:hypothetical protein
VIRASLCLNCFCTTAGVAPSARRGLADHRPDSSRFTIRGVTKAEKLTLKVQGAGTGSGTIDGTMAFDGKQYGMNSGIPFIKISNRVEVTIKFKAVRVSGPPVALKK